MNQLIESLWAVFDDPSFHRSLSWIVILVAPIIAFSLLVFKPSTYGKLQGQKARFGPLVSAKWSWIVMESPNLILGWICWARRTLEPMPRANSLLLSWFIWHYIHRTIIYPLKLSAKSQFPIGIMVSAMAYTTING
jgi:3-oxo-5-alpha-steroid 4-dehydrogenase 1